MNVKQLFEILVRDNADMLSTYLYSLVGSPELVDDLFQETMVTAWRKIDSFDHERSFAPWLRGIARNLVLDHYRKNRRELLMCNEHILDHLERQFTHIDMHKGDSWGEKTKALNYCLAQLPETLRLVIQLRYFSELRVTDLSGQLQISKEAVKKRLQRGKSALSECLKRRGLLVAETQT